MLASEPSVNHTWRCITVVWLHFWLFLLLLLLLLVVVVVVVAGVVVVVVVVVVLQKCSR